MTTNNLYIDTREFDQNIAAFVTEMKRKVDKDKYSVVTNMIAKASKPMEQAAQALAPMGNVTHTYTTKTGVKYTFEAGFLRKSIRIKKLAMAKGKGDPAVRITAFNKNKSKNAYYGGMVNTDHTIGKAKTFIKGKFFFQQAKEQQKEQFNRALEKQMLEYLNK